MGKGWGEGGRGGKGRGKKIEDTWENTVTYFAYYLHVDTSMWILLPDTHIQVFRLSIRKNNKCDYYCLYEYNRMTNNFRSKNFCSKNGILCFHQTMVKKHRAYKSLQSHVFCFGRWKVIQVRQWLINHLQSHSFQWLICCIFVGYMHQETKRK